MLAVDVGKPVASFKPLFADSFTVSYAAVVACFNSRHTGDNTPLFHIQKLSCMVAIFCRYNRPANSSAIDRAPRIESEVTPLLFRQH
jgi:hypothetical protein